MSDVLVSVSDLDFLRGVLVRVSTHLQAGDLANAEVNLHPVKYRPLTTLTDNAVTRIEGLIGDALLSRYKEDADAALSTPSVPADAEEAEPESGEEDAEEAEQLTLFDPKEYETPAPVKAARKKFGMLAE